MSKLYFASVPFVKEQVTLALESGVDGLIVPREHMRLAQGLARCEVLAWEDLSPVTLAARSDEEEAARR
ncbi:MAG: 3-dehydroquinate synthase II family protein, partial [Deltaproteobacteria bacterium]|nr:3-dehydroquinate synthase II family protein [Deltaproteobacteria bacterium]